MFPKTRARVDRAIDDASTDVRELTDSMTKTADGLLMFAAALVLVTLVSLAVSLVALDRSNQK